MNNPCNIPDRTLPVQPRPVTTCWQCQNDILEGESYYMPYFRLSCLQKAQRVASPGGQVQITLCRQCMEDSEIHDDPDDLPLEEE